MKAFVLAAVAALVFTANSAFADIEKVPLICLSEDGNLGVEALPDQHQVTLINGLNAATYVPVGDVGFVVINRILGIENPYDRTFTLVAKLGSGPNNGDLARVTSVGPIELEIKKNLIRASFYAYVSGRMYVGKVLETVPTTLTRCEYLLLDRTGI